MGVDIEIAAQRQIRGRWRTVHGSFQHGQSPFLDRNYGVFGLLADVTNYGRIVPICSPRGFPPDFKVPRHWSCHLAQSWLAIRELTEHDYGQIFLDQSGAYWGVLHVPDEPRYADVQMRPTGEPPQVATHRDYLGAYYFADLELLQELEVERIVFSFNC